MATSDLMGELDQMEHINGKLQITIKDAILQQLDDPSNDVQAVAVKCLATISRRFNESETLSIVRHLGHLCFDGKEELRDIYSIGVKTIVLSIPDSFGPNIGSCLLELLVKGIRERQVSSTQLLLCMELMKEVLKRFGGVVKAEHEGLMELLLHQLEQVERSVCKKTISCIGTLVPFLSDGLFVELVESVLEKAQEEKDDLKIYTWIQAIGTLTRASGSRIEGFLQDIIPMLIQFCDLDHGADHNDRIHIEINENCLQAFRSILLECKKGINPFLDKIIDLSIAFVAWDSNYNYGCLISPRGTRPSFFREPDSEEEWSDEDIDWDDSDGEDILGGKSEDDPTWQIRMCALLTLKAFILTQREHVGSKFDRIFDLLTDRLKERNDSVKVEVCGTLRELILLDDLNPSLTSLHSLPEVLLSRFGIEDHQVKHGILLVVHAFLQKSKHIDEKARRRLMQSCVQSLSSTEVELKSRALDCIQLLVRKFWTQDWVSVPEGLFPSLFACIEGPYSSLRIKAVEILTAVVEVGNSQTVFLQNALVLVRSQLQQRQLDFESKERLVHLFAFLLLNEKECAGDLKLLLDCGSDAHMRCSVTNAILFLSEKKVFDFASSGDWVSSLIRDSFGAFEAKLKVMHLLQSLLHRHPRVFTLGQISEFAVSCSSFLGSGDENLDSVIFQVLCSAISYNLNAKTKESILNSLATKLATGSVHIQSISFAEKFFSSLSSSESDSSCRYLIVHSLCSRVTDEMLDSNIEYVSRCCFACYTGISNVDMEIVIMKFVLLADKGPDAARAIAFSTLGHFARSLGINHELLMNIFLERLANCTGIVHTAACNAFGRFIAFHAKSHESSFLSKLSSHDSTEESLLVSLMVILEEKVILDPNQLIQILVENFKSPNECIRLLSAQCAGYVFALSPITLTLALRSASKSSDALERSSSIHALSHLVDYSSWELGVPELLEMLKDPDIEIRKLTVLSLSSVVHRNPPKEFNVIAHLIEELVIVSEKDESLVHDVDFGPFKQVVDDGLALRKAAFMCIETFCVVEGIDPFVSKLTHMLKKGCLDDDDIQHLSYRSLTKLATRRSISLDELLQELPDIIMKSIKMQVKKLKGNNPESAEDVLRSCIRFLMTVKDLIELDTFPDFDLLCSRVWKTSSLAGILSSTASSAPVNK